MYTMYTIHTYMYTYTYIYNQSSNIIEINFIFTTMKSYNATYY